MATPQPPYQDGAPEEGGQYSQNGAYGEPQQTGPAPAAGGKKKRAYAGQAYEFGAGANAAMGGAPPAGAPYAGPPAPAAAGYGYPAQQPAYG
ncbi:hypothetical protein KC315_g14889, partial [Hortaea werneckii]